MKKLRKILLVLLSLACVAFAALTLASCDFLFSEIGSESSSEGSSESGSESDGEKSDCEHTYSKWEEVLPATCTSIGYKTRTCSACGEDEYEFTAATGHDYGQWQDMISTCTEHWQVRICRVCGDSQTACAEPVHVFVGNVCENCGAVFGEVVDLNYLNAYNGRYGYEYLGTMDKGESLRKLYDSIDKEVKIFHANAALDAEEDLIVASLNYADSDLTIEDAVAVWKTYKDDNPLYYWLSNGIMYDDDNIFLLTESEYAEGKDRAVYNELVYGKTEEYLSLLHKEDGAYKTALAFHDFMIEENDYAYAANGLPETAGWAHNILGIFEGRGAVCEGYAKSFQLLLNYAEIENVFVTGTANGVGHAWNLVRLEDEKWYWCDLTWDDTGRGGRIFSNWFCRPDEDFSVNHTFDTNDGTGVNFLYGLPERATAEFSDKTQILLNTQFSVNNCDYTVVGYNAVELNAVRGTGSVSIPERVEYGGVAYTVVSIGVAGEYKEKTVVEKGITSVYLPETVKFIWDRALQQVSLENIYVDENNPLFRSLDGALYTKSLYTLIAYPSSNARTEYVLPDETRIIAYGAFSDCKYLTTLTFGANVSSFGIANWGNGYCDSDEDGRFGGNIITGEIQRVADSLTGAKKMIFDPNNKNYERDEIALYNRDKSTILYVFDKSITSYRVPSALQRIERNSSGSDVFDGCKKLKEFTVEEGNEWFSVYDGVLYNKTMTEIISIPRSIEGQIAIPSGVKGVGLKEGGIGVTFRDCGKLTAVVIPESVMFIGSSAFANCIGLTSVSIPESVTFIGFGAFDGCNKLTSIVIPDSVETIRECAFGNCDSLTEITIPKGVKFLGKHAFSGCKALTSVTFEVTEGWSADGASVSSSVLSDPANVAKILTDWEGSYYYCDWKRD